MTKTTKEYKGYHGSIEPDSDDQILRGKVLFIRDLITYQAESMRELQANFQDAVDDYLDQCEELKRDPQKPMSGSFNVRMDPELHRDLAVLAASDDESLNAVVNAACSSYLCMRRDGKSSLHVEHNHKHEVTVVLMGDAPVVRTAALGTTPAAWESPNHVH